MKPNRWIWMAASLVFFVALSCATSPSKSSSYKKKEAEASKRLGEAYITAGNYTLALQELLKAEALYPNDHTLQYDLGLVYMTIGKYDTSIDHLETAVRIKPDYAPAHNALGTAYAKQKNWDAAIRQYKKALKNLVYGTPYIAMANLGKIYYIKKEYLLSETYYRKALEVRPKYGFALLGLATTYMAMGREPEAIAELDKVVTLGPGSDSAFEAHFLLGKAYQRMGADKKALEEFNKVIQIRPQSTLAAEARREMGKIKTKGMRP